MTITEQWIQIEGAPAYSVSNLGQILRKLPGKGARAGHIMKPCPNRDGYYQLVLPLNGRRKSVKIARLVAYAFLGPCPLGHEVNHKDGNKANNTAENLEYVTRRQQMIHAFQTGLKKMLPPPPLGNANPQAKLMETDVRFILQSPESAGNLAIRYGVSRYHIYNILNGYKRTRVT